MFFLWPIGHDTTELRRVPRVTLAILLLNVVVFLFTFILQGSVGERAGVALREAVDFAFDHPHTEIDPRVLAALDPELARGIEEGLAQRRSASPPPEWSELQADKLKLARLGGIALTALERIQDRYELRLGYQPSQPSFATLLTTMFVHGGWEHLLGNLFLFYLLAPFVESAIGSIAFAGLYLIGGFGATLAHGAMNVGSEVPLIGASGAIFAVVGGFLVRFHSSKIRVFYFAWFVRIFVGSFWTPAYVLVPLAVVRELLHASWSQGSPVAHWAHLGGFAGGFAIALTLHLLDYERRFMTEAPAATPTVVLARVARARRLGQVVEARKMLDRLAHSMGRDPIVDDRITFREPKEKEDEKR